MRPWSLGAGRGSVASVGAAGLPSVLRCCGAAPVGGRGSGCLSAVVGRLASRVTSSRRCSVLSSVDCRAAVGWVLGVGKVLGAGCWSAGAGGVLEFDDH